MSAIRFAFISFLFLWGANVCAQEVDLFADERAYKMAGGNTGLFNLSKVTVPGWLAYMPYNAAPDTINIKFKRIEVSSFRFYVNESFFDSTLAYYNSSTFEKMFYQHPDSLETQAHWNKENYSNFLEKFMVLFKIIPP